jgi:hypothetical protein
MYSRSELRADCPRVIGQKSCVREAQPRGERNGRRCFLLFNGPVDRAAWRFDDPVTGTPGDASKPRHSGYPVGIASAKDRTHSARLGQIGS